MTFLKFSSYVFGQKLVEGRRETHCVMFSNLSSVIDVGEELGTNFAVFKVLLD